MRRFSIKKVLAWVMSAAIIMSVMPTTITALAKATSQGGGYLFAYFTGEDDGEQINFAVSKDGYNFEPLNGNEPVIPMPNIGTGHSRDPYVFAGQDGKYYMLATDDNATANGYRNTSLYSWVSTDLVNWDLNSNININDYISGTTRAWAPQAIWDDSENAYMLYWGQQVNNGRTVLYYAYTKDFKTLTSTPQVLFAPKNSNGDDIDVIDGDITYNNETGKYTLLFKNESEYNQDTNFSGKKVCLTLSDNLAGPYNYDDKEQFHLISMGTTSYEGCQVYNITGTSVYNLLMDDYASGGRGFIMYTSDDLVNFSEVSSDDYSINTCNPRHGSVMAISDSQYNALVEEYGKMTITQSGLTDNESSLDHLIARWFVKNDSTVDFSGHNNTLTTNNLPMTVVDGKICAQFKSNGATSTKDTAKGGYATISTSDMMKDVNLKDGVTFTFDAYTSTAGKIHFFDASNSAVGAIKGSGWGDNRADYDDFFLQTNGLFEAMNGKSENQSTATDITTNAWHTYAITVSKNFCGLYVDGNIKYSMTNVSDVNEDWFKNVFKSATSSMGIGISKWNNDPHFDGYISDFCVYDRALSASEVKAGIASLNSATELPLADNTDQQIYFDDCLGYTQTIDSELFDKVLQTSGTSVTSKIPSVNNTTVPGDGSYTISTWYNPLDSVGGNILQIGETNKSLVLTENGTLAYKNGTSFYNAKNLFTLKENELHYITIQIVPYADYERIFTYVDGKLVSTTNTYSDLESGTTYPQTTMTDLLEGGENTVYYGAGANEMLKDVSIYRGCISASDLYEKENFDYADKLIKNEMKKFEKKLATFSNTNILTNIAPAYKAYDEASRYIDSFTYGTVNSDINTVAALAKNLRDATNAIGVFEYYNPEETPVTINGSSDSAKYSNNVIFADDLNWNKGSMATTIDRNTWGAQIFTGNTQWRGDVEIFYGNVVFLYDGSTDNKADFTAPVQFSVVKSDANPTFKTYNRSICGMYPTESKGSATTNSIFTLQGGDTNPGYWCGHKTNEFVYEMGQTTDYVSGDEFNSAGKYSTDLTAGKQYMYSNVIQFDPTAALAKNNKIGGKYNLSWGVYGTSTQKGQTYANTNDTDKAIFENTRYAFYVVDYSGVKNALSSLDPNQIKNLTDYTSDTAMDLASAVDAMTSIKLDDSSVYDYKNGVGSAVNAVQKAVDKSTEEMKNAQDNIKIDNKADYDELRSDVTNETYKNEVTTLTGIDADTNEYTTSSTDAFLKAYNDAVEHFTNLDPTGNDAKYTSSEDVLNELGGKISNTYNALMPKADYKELDATYTSQDRKDISATGLIDDENDLSTQNYTIGSWAAFDTAATTAQKLSEDKSINDDAKYSKSDKNDQAKYKTDSDGAPIKDDLSDYQTAINDSDEKLNDAIDNMVVPSEDYSAYDAFMVVLGTQDRNAFTSDYLNSSNSVFKKGDINGTNTAAKTYSADNKDLADTAYITYNGKVYKNTGNIDSITSDMLTSLNEANEDTANNKRKSYKVTFKVDLDGTVTTLKSEELHYYGDVVTLDASSAAGALTCYKWQITSVTDATEGTTWSIANKSNQYTVQIQSDSVITAYCSKADVTPDVVKVNVCRVNGNSMYELKLPKTTQVTFGKGFVTIDGNDYTIPNSPFYTFSGWLVNGSSYSIGTVKTVEELCKGEDLSEISMIVRHTLNADKYEITLDGNSVKSGATYDELIEVTSSNENAYALIIDQEGVYSVVSYGPAYSFYANRDMDFYTVTKDKNGEYFVNGVAHKFSAADTYSLDNKFPFTYSAAMATGDDNDKFSTYSSYSMNVGDGVKITERGTLYTTNADVATNDAMLFGNDGIGYIKAKTALELSNQYSLTIKNSKQALANGTTYYTRSYVKYSYTYTDVKSGEETTVQCIAYGNICNDSALFD